MFLFRLELGYVYLPDGRLFPVDEVGLNLWNIGERGNPPTDYFFTFKAGTFVPILIEWMFQLIKLNKTAKRTWEVQVNVVESPVFYIGWEWEAKIVERMCTFQVNGTPGWGISEFMYRNLSGRPEEVEQKDPDWTRTINKG